MQINYYTTLVILLPIIFICCNVFLVFSIDKKLEYREFDIKYRDLNVLVKDVGVQKYQTRGGTCVNFVTTDDYKFERKYLGFIQKIIVHFHYNEIISKKNARVGFYTNAQTLSDNKDKEYSFISLDRGEEKDLWYYLDIYSFVKKKYSVFFVIVYLVLYLILFGICLKLSLIATQKTWWIVAITLPVLYMLI